MITKRTIAFLLATGIFLAVGFGVFFLGGCASSATKSTPGATTSAVVGTSESLANLLLPVAATVYGGPAAGAATQNALYSLENQLNPVVGKAVPISVIQNSTGTAALNNALVNSGLIKPGKTLSTGDIQTIDAAAAIAPALATALSNQSTTLREIQLNRIARYLDHRLHRPGVGKQIIVTLLQSGGSTR